MILIVKSTLFPGADVRLPHFDAVTGGFESVMIPDLPEQVKETTETGVWMSRLPVREFDVGRFPVIADGFSNGMLLRGTLGRALEADRVIGREADAAGSSFLAPHREVLGNVVLNPLLNVIGNRSLPSVQAVQWDDDGVVPDEFTLLKDGRVMDYCTSRDTAGSFKEWYALQSTAVRSHGCAVAEYADHPVQVRASHLHLRSSDRATSLEDLYKDVARGVLVLQAEYVSMDQQLASGMMPLPSGVFEIKRGKIVNRLRNVALSFNTRTLWKNLVALGDASTMRTSGDTDFKGNPWRTAWQGATAPAARFNAIDVITTGRNLS